MTQTSTNSEQEITERPDPGVTIADETNYKASRERMVLRLRLLWNRRRFLLRLTAIGLVIATLIAFLIPKRYESATQLMPPDSQATSGMAMLAAMTAKTGSGLGAVAGDLLGLKSSSALFIGILRSRTVQDRLADRFDLKKVYSVSLQQDARKKLSENTLISEDRKSGIIAITVTDRSPQRAAALATAYIEELNRLVAELSTSAAHRERVFLEERLKAVKQELDAAAEKFGQFASKNTAIDIKEQGRAMVEAAAALQGQLIAAQSEVQGLKQIYTDNNVRVRAVEARVQELQRQLEKLGGENTPSKNSEGQAADPLYPSIRQLPLLGVTYSDLFRQTKINEAVYETLTQEYELAKVQEAKDTPSVKVLDPARVPERKAFPPRLLIMFLGTFLSLSFGVVWVLGNATWAEIDPGDPGKVLAQEVFRTVKAQRPWASQNGSKLRAVSSKLWGRFKDQSSRREEQG